MAVYSYEARRGLERRRGMITADNPARGREMLRKAGLEVLRFAEQSDAGVSRGRRWWRAGGMKPEAVNEFTHYLALLLRVGVPLAEALGMLVSQAPPRSEAMLRRLGERVRGGDDLASAMQAEGGVFDATYLGVVRVGEASGMLEACLERLVRLRRRQRALVQRVQAALAYPAIVSMVGAAVVLFLMTFVVPRIAEVLLQTGRSLPLATRLLLGVSDFVRAWWWSIGPVAALGYAVVWRLDRRGRVRAFLRAALMRIPLLGPLVMKAGIAQSAALLETMLRSGLPLDESLRILSQTTGNVLLRREFQQMLESLRAGHALADRAGRATALPPAVGHMLAVGEQTGQLEDVLEELAEFYDAEVDLACRRAVSVLEPLLIVILSCVVGFIVMATILPILRLSGSL